MKLFIYEHLTSGTLAGKASASLLREADLMVRTLVAELRRLPGVELLAARDPGLPPLDGTRILTPAVGEPGEALYARGLAWADVAWPTAPETDGILARLARMTVEAGTRLVGCRPEAIQVAASKRQTSQVLAAAGVPVVATYTAAAPPPLAPGPWVVKPDDGAGAEDTRRVGSRPEALEMLAREPARLVAQPWLVGEPASLSLHCHAGTAEVLACNRLQVRVRDGWIALTGIEVNAFPDRGGRLAALAQQVVSVMPGLEGYVGIDLVRTAAGPVVLEVNPRLTTSYCGLGAALGLNLAGRILRGADGPVAAAPGRGSVTLILAHPDD